MNNPINGNPPPGTCYVNPSTGAAICTPPDNSAEGIENFIDGELSEHVDQYSDHTEGLNWRIANLGPAMDQGQLEAAIEQFMAEQGEGWPQELETYQTQVAGDGEELLQRLGLPEVRELSRSDRESLLQRILDEDNPQAQVAILTALIKPGTVDAATLDAAIEFFAGVDLANASPELAHALGQARLQVVGERLATMDPSDPASIAAARESIEALDGSGYAELLGIDGPQFDATIDALRDTLPAPDATAADIDAAFAAFADTADALDVSVPGDEPVAEGIRLLAMQSAAIGLEASGSGLFSGDPVDAVESLASTARVANSTTQLLVRSGVLASEGILATTVGNPVLKGVLGRIGIGLGVIQFARDLNEGDYAQASLTGVGIGGLALSTFGTTSWAGPVGIALGVIAFGGSLGLNQWRRVDASNEFMNDTSRDFLIQAGLSADAADALVDQSGEGHSPVPFLFAYAASQGLDRDQTVVWLNSLDADDLASIRDRAHEVLDSVDGDWTQVQNGDVDQDTLAYLSDFRGASTGGGYTWHQGNDFQVGDNYREIVAGSWAEFTALLEAKGMQPPVPPLPNDGAPMDVATATETLLADFDAVSGNGDEITVDDLASIRNDESADPRLRLAAEFVLNSRVTRNFLDVGQGKGDVDGKISRDDLEGALETIASGDYLDELVDTARGRGGRDGEVSSEDVSAALVDPGLTVAQRHAMGGYRTG